MTTGLITVILVLIFLFLCDALMILTARWLKGRPSKTKLD